MEDNRLALTEQIAFFAKEKAIELKVHAADMIDCLTIAAVTMAFTLKGRELSAREAIQNVVEMTMENAKAVIEGVGESLSYDNKTTQAAISSRQETQLVVDIWNAEGKQGKVVVSSTGNDDADVLRAMRIFENE